MQPEQECRASSVQAFELGVGFGRDTEQLGTLKLNVNVNDLASSDSAYSKVVTKKSSH